MNTLLVYGGNFCQSLDIALPLLQLGIAALVGTGLKNQ